MSISSKSHESDSKEYTLVAPIAPNGKVPAALIRLRTRTTRGTARAAISGVGEEARERLQCKLEHQIR